MQFLTAQPYSRTDPPPAKSASWAVQLVSYLKKEFQAVQRGQARAGSVTVAAAYTATANDGLILADATGGAFAVTLPDPAKNPDAIITIKRMNGGGNAVTVGGTVDGTLNRTLGAQYASMTVWAHVTSAGAGTWNRIATV